jgi:hypothetical protein
VVKCQAIDIVDVIFTDLAAYPRPTMRSEPEIAVCAAHTAGGSSVYHFIRVRRESVMEECRKT